MSLQDAFDDGLERVLGDRYVGLFQYGAMCFPPSPISDFDAHVLVSEPFTDGDRDAIKLMVDGLPGIPNLEYMDVWYVTLDEARSSDPPQTQLRPGYRDDMWALHRAHWHAGRFVLVRGPDPRTIVPEPTWDEIDTSLQGELESIGEHIGETNAYNAYHVLNLCRVLHSYETRDVVTGKFQSAMWALAFLDVDHHALIREALEAYRTETYTVASDREAFFEEMSARIGRARQRVGTV
jgi:hypothetical protein